GSIDNTVRLWNVANGAQIAALEAHEERVTAVGVTPDGQTIASASWDGKVRLWRSELARLCLLPAVQSTLQDLDWAVDASGDGRLSAQEQTWLEFLVTLMRWRRRHDIALSDTSHFEVGEFDITIESG
ncbi:MAG: hypothetical protein Q7R47_05755, partial [Candidatus Diapherotrites archaeon]|nr:hypothetical protein [Candidatus Diapherotrites archaeon]